MVSLKLVLCSWKWTHHGNYTLRTPFTSVTRFAALDCSIMGNILSWIQHLFVAGSFQQPARWTGPSSSLRHGLCRVAVFLVLFQMVQNLECITNECQGKKNSKESSSTNPTIPFLLLKWFLYIPLLLRIIDQHENTLRCLCCLAQATCRPWGLKNLDFFIPPIDGNNLHLPRKLRNANGWKIPPWMRRCVLISYWKWGILQLVMLVFREGKTKKLSIQGKRWINWIL